MANLAEILGSIGLGLVGGFASEKARLGQEKKQRDFNSVLRVMQAASAAGESDFFTPETLKTFKGAGGDEGVFGALRDFSLLDIPQEQRSTLINALIEQSAKAKAGTAKAGVAQQIFAGIEQAGKAGQIGQRLPPEAILGAAGLEGAAEAGTAARRATVAERGAATQERQATVAERGAAVRERIAGVEEQRVEFQAEVARDRIQLDRELGRGKLDAFVRQVDLQGRELDITESRVRGLLAADIQQSGIKAGDAQVLAKHFLTGDPIKDKRLADLVPQARLSLSEVTGALNANLNSFKSRKALLNTVKAQAVRGKVAPAEVASVLDEHNALVLQEVQSLGSIGRLATQQQVISYIMNNMVFRTPDGRIVNLRVAQQQGIDFSKLTPTVPQGIGRTDEPSPAAGGFVGQALGRSQGP